jgi:hypothetical protein
MNALGHIFHGKQIIVLLLGNSAMIMVPGGPSVPLLWGTTLSLGGVVLNW